jgi:hypothetical protein
MQRRKLLTIKTLGAVLRRDGIAKERGQAQLAAASDKRLSLPPCERGGGERMGEQSWEVGVAPSSAG